MGVDRWFLIASTLLAAVAGVRGLLVLRNGHKSHWTVWWMVGVMLCQIGYLASAGRNARGLPLRSTAEISVFLAWSLTVILPLRRTGLSDFASWCFHGPGGGNFPSLALLPGGLDPTPEKVLNTTVLG